MKLLFLDIDGVLNDHKRMANGLSTIQPDKVALLNLILERVPSLQLVISSAWRYYVHNGHMTPEGFELMLQAFGVNCHKRIHGFTDPDPETFIPGESNEILVVNPDCTFSHTIGADEAHWRERGLKWRKDQCVKYAETHCTGYPWVVIDDLPLDLANLIHTTPEIGMTLYHAMEIIRRLS